MTTRAFQEEWCRADGLTKAEQKRWKEIAQEVFDEIVVWTEVFLESTHPKKAIRDYCARLGDDDDVALNITLKFIPYFFKPAGFQAMAVRQWRDDEADPVEAAHTRGIFIGSLFAVAYLM